nr:MAG TPA: hypothetical protein [Caudoviricetes sp.]DAP54138.1 MAG TPA: hypothetical protein [Caudoviricetes sp.]
MLRVSILFSKQQNCNPEIQEILEREVTKQCQM